MQLRPAVPRHLIGQRDCCFSNAL
uniref:Uncharacterized protein n=1 Tax=Anguilla anguilla TaxID=7936 RepID=A0A0E9Q257_ANGAN